MESRESGNSGDATDAVLAPEPIERLREMGRALGMEVPSRIIGLFLDDAPVRLAALERSLRDDDAGTLERAAHSLRGSSANLGATSFAERCYEIELLATGGDLAPVRERLDRLQADFERVDRALRELLVELG